MKNQKEVKFRKDNRSLEEKMFSYDLSETRLADYPTLAMQSLKEDTNIYTSWLNYLASDA